MGALRLAGGGGGCGRVWLRETLHVPRGGRRWPLSRLSSPRAQPGPLHGDPPAGPSPPSPWPHPCAQGGGRADPRSDPRPLQLQQQPKGQAQLTPDGTHGSAMAGAGKEEELGRAASSSRAVGGSHCRMMGCVCVDLGGTPWDSQETRRQQVGPPVSCKTGHLPRTVRFAFKDRKEELCPFSPSRCRALRSGCRTPALTRLWVGGCFPPWEILVSGPRRTIRHQLPWTEAPRLYQSEEAVSPP